MKKMFLSTAIVLAILSLSGCGKEAPPAPPPPTAKENLDAFKAIEDNRSIARENALWNAKMYMADNPRFDEGFKIISHGDSTQSPDCPQGDGWASVSFMKVVDKKVEKYTAKCSTVSSTVGCYLDADFMKKPYSKEDGQCQPLSKVPYPTPKLTK